MKPNYTITNRIVLLIANIIQIIGNLEATHNLDLRLRKENRIKSIHSSLAIENNSLTLEQITTIISGRRIIADPKEISEVVNAFDAYEEILKFNPYNIDDFLKAHGLLTNGIVNGSGSFRSSDVGIYANGSVVHMGARPQYIYNLVSELFSWGRDEKVHDIIKSCVIHYEIENIHPFEDGNGRMGRLWQSVILSNWNELFAWIPIETIIYRNQSEYYSVLRESDINNDCTVFIEFILESILTTLNEYKTFDYAEELNSEELEVYEIICNYLKGNKYVTTAIASKLTSKSTSTIRRYFAKYIKLNLLSSVGENKNRKYYLK